MGCLGCQLLHSPGATKPITVLESAGFPKPNHLAFVSTTQVQNSNTFIVSLLDDLVTITTKSKGSCLEHNTVGQNGLQEANAALLVVQLMEDIAGPPAIENIPVPPSLVQYSHQRVCPHQGLSPFSCGKLGSHLVHQNKITAGTDARQCCPHSFWILQRLTLSSTIPVFKTSRLKQQLTG